MLKLLVDNIIKLGSIRHPNVLIFVGLFILVQILFSFVQQWSAYFLQKQQYLLSEHISLRVLTKAAEIDYAYYEDPAFYDSLHMTQNKSAYLPAQIISTLQTLIQQSLLFIALALFLFSIHWSIPFILLFLSLPMAFSKMLFGRQQFDLEKSIVPVQRKGFELYNYITTNHYAKELRIFDFGRYFTELYRKVQEEIFIKRNKLQYIFLQKSMFVGFFEVISITLFYLVLIQRSISGAITIGSLIIYFQAFQRLQVSVSGIFTSVVSLFQNQLYLQEIIKYFNLPITRSIGADLNEKLEGPPDSIEVRNLSFSYPGTENEVLKDINMIFPKGKFVAIVGENGSGKSTMLKLLCGLYSATQGELYFNEIPSGKIPGSYFSKNISVVFQDFGKYYMTVEDNIAIGQAEKNPEKIELVLKAATGDKMVNSLHAGIGTTLGRSHKLGEELSGGQWQKIAIARALYKDARVLILDEPTSAIDPVAELEFFQHLRENINDRIIILITHRLYNLKLTDYIYVMEDSRIMESGSFNELIKKEGYFSRYYNAQKI
jgi:ATP-binding cassette subfamily B protein